ncbi:MAG: amino acid adenylation domain-containing protein [Candidatus Dormibacter sp.]
MTDDRGGSTRGALSRTIPLSVTQEQLWYFSQLAPDNPIYNEVVSIRKTGELNREALQRAFNEVVRRHEALRSTFRVVNEHPVQVVQPPPVFELALIDLRDSAGGDAAHDAAKIAAELAREPYQLDTGPLLRPLLVRFADDEHRLYLALHHLIFDGVSLNRVVVPELVALYDAFAAGEQPAMAEPPAQYEDYAAWSHDWTRTPDFEQRLEYWRRHLEGATELPLPLDHPRPRQQRFHGGMERIRIPRDITARLGSLGSLCHATLFQVLASAFAILLHRLAAGHDDVVFGTVSDMRQRPELESIVGYCVTSLVLRADLSGDPTFMDVLGRMRGELLEDIAHQVPFSRLVRDLQPRRQPGTNPIFQAMIVLEPSLESEPHGWSLHAEEVEVGNAIGNAKFDLLVELDLRPEGHLEGRVGYNGDLFDRETAQRLTGNWLTLLDGISTSPDRRVSELPLLTEGEIRRQQVEWNRTDVDLPLERCVHELITDQAHRTPDAVAVTNGSERLTYRQLDEQAGRLATYIRERGVGPDVTVGVCLERSFDLVVALLGVLKAGGAFVPLEPDQPRDRLAHMIGDAEPRVILTAARVQGSLPPTTASVVRLDTERDAWMARASLITTDGTPSNLAYVLFTSGSTGTPKGVMIEHRSIVNQLAWRVNSFRLGPDDRILQKTPLGFDVSMWEFFCPLIAGATLVLLDAGAHRDPARVADAIRSHGITVVHFSPVMLDAFLGAAGDETFDSVRLVLVGGETLPAALARRFFGCFDSGVELRNCYGPTETTVAATSWRCDPAGEEVVPIGRPVANTQTYVLDSACRLVPQGVAGELCIGGAQVARGYVNRPELTAEGFVANPFRPGERMYRTGDVVRHRADGSIEFLGRKDSQVKIRGNRVELGEIEAAMATHPALAAAVAMAWDDPESGERRLVAYVVPATQPPPRLAELRDHAVRLLPDPMVPAAFVILDALPVTPTGKINRRALPRPEAGRLAAEAAYVAPRTDAEATLAGIWAQLLGVERVGVDDNFFELGGDSILSIQIVARANRAGLRLTPAQLFEHQTVAMLAAASGTSDALADEAVRNDGEGGVTPLDFPLAGLDQATLDRLLG